MAIDGIRPVGSITPPSASPKAAPVAEGFGEALQKLVASVDGSAADANSAVGRMLEGTGDVHEAVIAVQKADTLLQLTVQVRNKLVQAYQDIMRMPV